MIMSSSKHHLRELLNEDQEPFILKNYINDKRTLLRSNSSKPHVQLKKTKPIFQSQNSIFNSHFCKTACFNVKNNNPTSTPNKNPLFSPAKSPARPNTILIHVPTRTAALLLEAALRIQSQNQKQPQKSYSSKFGFLGSILKKLGNNKRKSSKDNVEEVEVSVKKILSKKVLFNVENGLNGVEVVKGSSNLDLDCSCDNSRLSSAWSEEKSLATSSSSCSSEEEELRDDEADEEMFHGSSPFRFILQSEEEIQECHTPEFDTPASSPARRKQQEVNNEEEVNSEKKQCDQEEEEKEQNSPVSVLEPLFEDDDDDDEGHDDNDEQQNEYELEHSFALVQRAKLQLLNKLRRFELLADLDPTELEGRLTEEEESFSEYDKESVQSNITSDDLYIDDVWYQHIPLEMKRLVMDLVAEETMEHLLDPCYNEMVAKKVREKLELWKEVESNTIDMMVELDLRRDSDGWMKTREQLLEASAVIEHAIFNYLIAELSEELVYSDGHCGETSCSFT